MLVLELEVLNAVYMKSHIQTNVTMEPTEVYMHMHACNSLRGTSVKCQRDSTWPAGNIDNWQMQHCIGQSDSSVTAI